MCMIERSEFVVMNVLVWPLRLRRVPLRGQNTPHYYYHTPPSLRLYIHRTHNKLTQQQQQHTTTITRRLCTEAEQTAPASKQLQQHPVTVDDALEEELYNAMTPHQVVAELDRYIVGQTEAKKAVALAFRNRWRMRHLPPELREIVIPKNILMIGEYVHTTPRDLCLYRTNRG